MTRWFEIFEQATVRPRATHHAPPRKDTGTRVLIVMALLYVVGTTTFLLARELTRPAASAPGARPRGWPA